VTLCFQCAVYKLIYLLTYLKSPISVLIWMILTSYLAQFPSYCRVLAQIFAFDMAGYLSLTHLFGVNP